MIVEVNKLVEARVSKKFICSLLQKAHRQIKPQKKIKEISVALVGSKEIKLLNRQYRKVNQVTDVLSFTDPAQIVICWPQVVIQSKNQGHSQKKELSFLLVHGFLHILGYEHKTKKGEKIMNKKIEKIIS
jgi:probable rRNA maturation factor